jgi:hydrogenase maturation protease
MKQFITLDDLIKGFESSILKFKKISIIGIGAEFRQDDAVGTQLLKQLITKFECLSQSLNVSYSDFHIDEYIRFQNLLLINGTVLPEQYVDIIADFNPDYMIIIDAAVYNGDQFPILKTDIDSWTFSPVSSHMIPLSQFISMIKLINPKFVPNIDVIGIKAQNIFFGEDLSESVQYIKNCIQEFFITNLIKNIQKNDRNQTKSP